MRKQIKNIKDIKNKYEIINEISKEFDLTQLKENIFESICEILTDINAENKDYKKAQLLRLVNGSKYYKYNIGIICKVLEKIDARYPKSTKEKIEDVVYAVEDFGRDTVELLRDFVEDKAKEIKTNIDEFYMSPQEIAFGVSIIMTGLSFTQSAYLREAKNKPVDKTLIPTQIVTVDEFESKDNYKFVNPSEDSNMPMKKEFNPGEHTLLKVFDSEDTSLHIDGYEIVGIAVTENKSKVAVVYKNTSKVECTKTDDGYNNFGKTIKNKTLVLK